MNKLNKQYMNKLKEKNIWFSKIISIKEKEDGQIFCCTCLLINNLVIKLYIFRQGTFMVFLNACK